MSVTTVTINDSGDKELYIRWKYIECHFMGGMMFKLEQTYSGLVAGEMKLAEGR